MKKSLLATLAICFSLNSIAQTPEVFRQWGDECLEMIENNYRKTNYNYLYDENSNDAYPAFAWPTGIMLKALVYAGEMEKAVGYAKEFDQHYAYSADGYRAYDAVCGGRGGRHYDDNAWMVKDFMEIYELTNERWFLETAQKIMLFCMSGECPSGGIRFHEDFSDPNHEEYDIFATCATAPTAVANLQIYKATGVGVYLEDGKRLYEVMKNAPWGVGPGFRGYENAVIMEAAILLYEITGEEVYLKDAQWLGNAMEAWYISWQTGQLNECGKWGGHDMTDAYVLLYETDGDTKWLDIAARYLTYLYENCRSDNGSYPEIWNQKENNNPDLLIEQASAASAFYKMALSPGGNPENRKAPVAVFQNEAQNSNGTSWGWSIGLEPGYYSREDLIFLGMTDTRFNFVPDISSVYVSKDYKLVLYDAEGESIEYTRPANFLDAWNDRAVALRVIDLNDETSVEGIQQEEKIVVCPTISEKEITIENLATGALVELFDVTGSKVYSDRAGNKEKETVDLSCLPKGIYILKIVSEGKEQTTKIMKR